MKRFFRTVGGKLTLFVCCILCLGLLAGSAALGVFLLEEEVFYTSTEAELRERDLLRREYIDSVKANLTAQLDHTWVVDQNGTKRPLRKKTQEGTEA